MSVVVTEGSHPTLQSINMVCFWSQLQPQIDTFEQQVQVDWAKTESRDKKNQYPAKINTSGKYPNVGF